MGNAPAFASVSEAMDMARAALGYLAAADAAQLAAETQAECLRDLERADATITAARASFLSAFTVGQGYSADADYSARAWLIHKTGITRGAAAAHTAWAKRAATHPRVLAALATKELSESYGRTICQWTEKLPEKFRDESDELLIAAAAAGLGLRDLAALFAEMYERARGDLREDPARGSRTGACGWRRLPGGRSGDLTPEWPPRSSASRRSALAGAEATTTGDRAGERMPGGKALRAPGTIWPCRSHREPAGANGAASACSHRRRGDGQGLGQRIHPWPISSG